VREAWFSAISDKLVGSQVLDLFAGSGALGIEALSRGAERATFVEKDGRAMKTLRDNIETLGMGGRTSIVRSDVFRALASPDLQGARFDLALADPPYGAGLARQLVEVWLERPFSGMLCVEHSRAELDGMQPDWVRVYGDTELSFFIGAGGTG
jgi:16S rRNA (guanine(966)-N(2))-methyltransferase RsmD